MQEHAVGQELRVGSCNGTCGLIVSVMHIYQTKKLEAATKFKYQIWGVALNGLNEVKSV